MITKMRSLSLLSAWLSTWLLLAGVPLMHSFQLPSSSTSKSTLPSTWRLYSTTADPKTTSTTSKTNIKYPTARGSEVDSRKIIQQYQQLQKPLLALRLSHILIQTEGLAEETLEKIVRGEWNFEEMARRISDCKESREEGGNLGWVNLSEEFEVQSDGSIVQHYAPPNAVGTTDVTETDSQRKRNPNEHLNDLLPPTARYEILQCIHTKPGDVVKVTSERGVHLVMVQDVMVDVRKLSLVRERKGSKNDTGGAKVNSKQHVSLADANHGSKLQSLLENQLYINPTLSEEDIESKTLGKELATMTYKIETMGCQMNSADSERIEGQLMSLGMRPLLDDEYDEEVMEKKELADGLVQETKKVKRSKRKPDVVVLNTCSIRDHAEQKVYSYLGPHAKRKRSGEDLTIIVAGCVAQQEGKSLLTRIPEIDLVMGPQYANRISDLLEDVANGNQVVATEASHIMEDSTKPRRQSEVCAWVNVIYGCNERCTYCIVPTTRGVEQSRPVESIVEEVKELVGRGYKEVTLLGQNIDAYGRDMIPKRKFSDLLRIVGGTPGLERLRFVTSHPRYMSLGVVDAVAETPTACEYFHVPFQSGSNNILKAMGRGHTREKFLQIVDRIRQRLPDAAITADVIVGFPGETEQDFLDTLDIMNQVKFDNVNTAAYSPRPNTPAATWTNQLSDEIKQDRLQRINELNLQHATERRARMIDRVVEVLVEERNVKVPTQVMGRTRHGYILYLEGDIEELRGKLVDVKVDKCQRYYLAGKIVDVKN